MISDGTNLFAGTGGGVYLSTNNGISWTAVNTGLPYPYISALAMSPDGTGGTNIFAGNYTNATGTLQSGVFLSTNNGLNWSEVNTGLPRTTYIYSLITSKTNLIAGTSDGLWRRPLSEITSVEQSSYRLPERFSLSQNYPNPFNPSTTIEYQIPKQSYVTLRIFDLLGREVATLVNEKREAGSYRVQFDGAGLSSGVYFYQLRGGEFVQTKKLILQK
jgi:hypothetical protein